MFYIDVRGTDFYDFYYNMVAEVNKNVTKVVGDLTDRPINDRAKYYINNRLNGGLSKSYGPSEFGVIGVRNNGTNQFEYLYADEMLGISAKVSANMAQEILDKAIEWCPKDTGNLASSGRIEQNSDGSCRIYFDCPYAWYVHQFSWRNHEYPTRHHFLTEAIRDVETRYGLWAKRG